MKTIIDDHSYNKLDKSTRKIIARGISKLRDRYEYYEGSKYIFNDDTLVHDIIRKRYFVYKCRIDKIQLRILYFAENDNLIVIGSYIKKKNNKEYIGIFEKTASEYEKSKAGTKYHS